MTSTIYTEIKLCEGAYGIRVVPKEFPNYCGIEDIGFIWHGEWSDPELEYDGNIYNIYDFEDEAKALFDEQQKDYLVKDNTEDGFYNWLSNNKNNAYEVLSWIIPCKVK